MKNRFMHIGAAYLFLIQDNKILLQRRCNTGYEDGNYGVPSGHLEGNETAREGCSREMIEEIGIGIKPQNLKVVHTMHRMGEITGRVDFFMTTDKYDGEIRNMEPEKCDDLSWFNLDKLPDNMVGYVKNALEHYRNGVFYSEDNF